MAFVDDIGAEVLANLDATLRVKLSKTPMVALKDTRLSKELFPNCGDNLSRVAKSRHIKAILLRQKEQKGKQVTYPVSDERRVQLDYFEGKTVYGYLARHAREPRVCYCINDAGIDRQLQYEQVDFSEHYQTGDQTQTELRIESDLTEPSVAGTSFYHPQDNFGKRTDEVGIDKSIATKTQTRQLNTRLEANTEESATLKFLKSAEASIRSAIVVNHAESKEKEKHTKDVDDVGVRGGHSKHQGHPDEAQQSGSQTTVLCRLPQPLSFEDGKTFEETFLEISPPDSNAGMFKTKNSTSEEMDGKQW